MSEFYALLTDVGAAKARAAALVSSSMKIYEFAVCDSETDPVATQTTLLNEVYRGGITDGEITDDGTAMIVESYIPSDLDTEVYPDAFTVRNLGLYDTDDDLVVIAKVPPTYKSNLGGGAAVDLRTRVIFTIENSESITLQIDPLTIFATREYVDGQLNALRSEKLANLYRTGT